MDYIGLNECVFIVFCDIFNVNFMWYEFYVNGLWIVMELDNLEVIKWVCVGIFG